VIYSWLNRGERLADNLPLAKTYPMKIGEAKRAEVVVKYTDNHGLMSAWEVSRYVGGVCASKAAEIIRDIRPYILARQEMLREAFKRNSYEFLKKHVCWSWDYMNVQVGEEKLQLQMLIDEYTRYILGWTLTAGVNFWQFRRLVCQAIKRYGVKPLVLKHDNDIILRGAGEFLAAKRIVDLPGPTYYSRFQARMERGNLDVRKNLAWYEDNACLTYSEMYERIYRVVTILRDVKPREIFGGKVCVDILRDSPSITEIGPEELISRIQDREAGWKGLFAGKKGLKKMHRYAVIEELKEAKLLKVEMEHWQDFAGKFRYN
jgi:hypothetical protein